MKYRQLGSTDLKVSTITFGAWVIGGWTDYIDLYQIHWPDSTTPVAVQPLALSINRSSPALSRASSFAKVAWKD